MDQSLAMIFIQTIEANLHFLQQSRIIFSWFFFQLLNPQCNSGTGVGVGGGGLLGGGGTTGTSSSLHSYRIEANSFRRKPAHQHTVFEFTK